MANQFMIDPMDHGSRNDGRCRCKKCNEFRKKHPGADDTELYWQTIAYVAQKMEKKHPGKYITTLVYPPRSGFPETVKLPSNIQVHICRSGIKNMLLPKVLENDIALIEKWGKHTGGKNIPLWTYQCENFGRRLPGVPENHPYLSAEYLRKMAGRIAGIRNEFTDPVYSTRFPDLYIQSKLLWNPHQDVKKLLKDYFRVMYGPAAGVMEEIYRTFENNFRKYYVAVTPNVPNSKEIGLALDASSKRRFVWSKIYTPKGPPSPIAAQEPDLKYGPTLARWRICSGLFDLRDQFFHVETSGAEHSGKDGAISSTVSRCRKYVAKSVSGSALLLKIKNRVLY